MINFLKFAAAYGLTKCVKTMLMGTAFMAVIYVIAKINRGRKALLDYYALLLLPLALFSGMSRLFYVHGIVWVSAVLSKYCTIRLGQLYFGVAILLFCVYLGKNIYTKRRAQCLPEYEDRALAERIKKAVCSRDVTGFGAWYLRRVRIFVTDGEISPYCGGLLHPYVVLPQCVCRWSAPSVEAILCHELVHIRMGHIFVMMVYRFLACLWWVHPLIYACEKRLHELMEQVCDERVIFLSGMKREVYGELLLGLVQVLRKGAPAGSAAFFRRSDFQILHARLMALKKQDLCRRNRRREAQGFSAVFGAILLLLALTSYPRYTMLTEIGLYDEKLQLRAYDTAELNEAVQVMDGRLLVEPKRFAALVDELDIEGAHVYVTFGGFMKVPGAGGGGDAGMISLADYSDIFYLRADVWENDVMEFMAKYLI